MSLAAPSKTLTMKLSRALVYNIDRGKMLKVYSKNNCPFCTQAKNLLNSKNISFEEVKIDEDTQAREFVVSKGHRTVPQIYQDGELLVEGGYQGLAKQSDEFFQTLKG